MVTTRSLIIRDEVHGDMAFDPLLKQVIDHELFQRLRYIKQLGLTEYVFPCATHTRFQHSLGASYLAGQYFDSLLTSWVTTPFRFEGNLESTTLFTVRTKNTVSEVAKDKASSNYWKRVICLAALLHDVGHGPWSHAFEHLRLKQNFSDDIASLKEPLRLAFERLLLQHGELQHEEISVLYTVKILSSLGVADQYMMPVITLINKRLLEGAEKHKIEESILTVLDREKILGGLDFHQLLLPLISGPFDVDRIDYIQRDGKNCGVHIAGIEWRRIVSKIIPCLANHQSDYGEPKNVVLLSHIRNQHIIDDFIFTLFQMYAQVYMHPKIVGLEEAIKRVLEKEISSHPDFLIDFTTHSSLSDERFKDLLANKFKITAIRDLLLRARSAKFEVDRYPRGDKVQTILKQSGFERVNNLGRPMLKDGMGVFLFSHIREGSAEQTFLESWISVSPVAKHLFSIHYAPNIWLKTCK